MAQMNDVKRVPVIACTIDAGVIKLDCVNGQSLSIDASALTDEIRHYAMMHGLKQKLIDAAAISRNPDTGRSASPDDKWKAVCEVATRISGPDGQWNAARGEGGTGAGGLLFRALVRLYPGKTADQLRAFLEGKTKAEQAALRTNPKISAIIEEIKAESAKSGEDLDTDAMLDELEG